MITSFLMRTFFSIFIIFKLVTCFIDSLTFGMKAHSIAYLRSESEHIYWILNQWSGKTDSQFIISQWISPHGRSKFPTIGWQSDCNFNPPAISRWTRKCPGNVADSSCELPDFSRKKYSNTGRYPGNGNRYPPGHEHGYQAGIEGCRFAPPNFQLKNSKDPPFDAHQQINRGHRNF